MFYSPLRYPGGKNKLAKFVASICDLNSINGHYIEPYAGGASVALFLLMEGKVSRITINDVDRSIYSFWYSVLNNTSGLCRLIRKTDITIENWKIQKEIQKNKDSANLLELGFSTLFLNRTNMSGILNGGIIGGLNQKGKYKINCRFNKAEIIRRIKKIAQNKARITLYNLDALEVIKKIQQSSSKKDTIFYFDPPYFLKGKSLYLNHYTDDDHREVSIAIRSIKNARWIVSYDNTSIIKNLYSDFRKKEYLLTHTARTSRVGREVLFFSDQLIIPRTSQQILKQLSGSMSVV
jgi:DNA adenine methylase